jgi:alpha-L-fucosidase
VIEILFQEERMLSTTMRRTLLVKMSLMLAFFAIPTYSQNASSPTAPTASEDPAVIDQAWQDASAKFASQRERLLKEVDRADHQGPYRPDWESLQKYEIPDWYQNAKFGIFIHWGVYSVPAFANEWYPRNMYVKGSEEYKHHISTYGPQDKFGYKDLVPLFKAEKFDPTAWARLFNGRREICGSGGRTS